jgi:hypothetical protein
MDTSDWVDNILADSCSNLADKEKSEEQKIILYNLYLR